MQLNYKCINTVASIGDSVAGGVILGINENEMKFFKDGEYKFLPLPSLNNLTDFLQAGHW